VRSHRTHPRPANPPSATGCREDAGTRRLRTALLLLSSASSPFAMGGRARRKPPVRSGTSTLRALDYAGSILPAARCAAAACSRFLRAVPCCLSIAPGGATHPIFRAHSRAAGLERAVLRANALCISCRQITAVSFLKHAASGRRPLRSALGIVWDGQNVLHLFCSTLRVFLLAYYSGFTACGLKHNTRVLI